MAYTDYLSQVAADGPVAQWNHTETSGTSLADATGNSRTGTAAGGLLINQTSTIPGYNGPVVVFDGVDDKITVADATPLDAVDAQGFTYSRWLKMTTPGNDVLYTVADKTGLSTSNKQWGIWWDNRTSQSSPMRLRTMWGNQTVGVGWVDWSGTAARDALAAGGLLTVVWRDPSTTFIYWNGELVAGGMMDKFPTAAGNVGNTRTVNIGHNSTTFFFKGEMGAGAAYDKDIPAHRVKAHYAATIGNAYPVVTKTIANTAVVDTSDYNSFPGLVKCPNGDLLGVYRRANDHTAADITDGLMAVRSTDNGATWGTPTQIITNDSSTQYLTAALSVVGSNVALVSWVRPLTGGTPTTDGIRIFMSSDNGATWGAPITPDTGTWLSYFALSESPLVYWGGYYYLAVYGQDTSTAVDYAAGVLRSSDLSTWTRVALFDTGGTNGYSECGVVLIGSTLVCLVRRESDYSVYSSTSTDGTTWSTITRARVASWSAPRPSPVGPLGKAYIIQRNATDKGATLCSVDATGAVLEVEPLGQNIPNLYGQVAVVDTDTIVGLWAAEVGSTNGDIYAAKWTIALTPTVGVGSFQWAGSGVGSAPVSGSGSGGFTWAGVAVGGSAKVGAGAGSFTWAGSAVGAADLSGAGTGSFDWAGSAVGVSPAYGVGSGAFDWAGVASGLAEVGPLLLSAPSPRFATVAFGDGGETYDTEVLHVSANSERGARVSLILTPAAVPLVLNEWPIQRQAHLMDALSAEHPRYAPHDDYEVAYANVGRLHVWVDGVDMTFLRGCPTMIGEAVESTPLGDDRASLEFPQIKPWDIPGTGDLSVLREDAPVEVALIRPDDSRQHIFDGFVSSFSDSSGDGREAYTVECEGVLAQAMHEPWEPPLFLDETDIGTLIPDALNAVPGRRWAKIPRTVTGFTSSDRGSQDNSVWQQVQNWLSPAWTEDGRQLALVRVAHGVYRLQVKAPVTTVHWTVTKGAPGVSVDLVHDANTRRDSVYGRGVAPDGGVWANWFFPFLDQFVPPPYPMAGFANMSVGTTDADTTNGRGVSQWQRRMRELGYNVKVDGVMNSSDTQWVLRVQKARGLATDGSLGPQTWNGTFDPGATEVDIRAVRRPLATKPQVEPYVYAANGARGGRNPAYDPRIIRHAMPGVNFGTGVRKRDSYAPAASILAREGTTGAAGTITLTTDPHEFGASRLDIRAGHNVAVIGHRGDVVVQVASVSHGQLSSTLTVDERARDAMSVEAILERNRESRKNVTNRRGHTRASELDRADVVQYESESQAGTLPRYAVNGNSGLWSVVPIFVSQVGVAKIRLEATTPKAEIVCGLFSRPITPNKLAHFLPNPLASSDGWYDNVDTLKGKFGCMEVFGTPDSPGGYSPREKGKGALTGILEDSSSTLYDSGYGGVVWVALYTSRSTWVEGRIFPAVPQ